MKKWVVSAFMLLPAIAAAQSQAPARSPAAYDSVAALFGETALGDNRAIELLSDLCAGGPRLSGSPQADRAVAWAKRTMEQLGFDRVWTEPVMVPHWVRGSVETAEAIPSRSGRHMPLAVTALGGSIGTSRQGITAELIEVHSLDELREKAGDARGKIVFFNRPMDRGLMNTFAAYGGAVDQRGGGAIAAAMAGGVAALVRSMTTTIDDHPHTGAMGYRDSIPKVPAAAVSTLDADRLSALLQKDPHTKVRLTLSCQTLPDVESANVIGEIRGTERPDEVIVVGGHLDSWDLAQGAHDDGSGCVQSIEALRLLKELGLKPKRTIRAVMFMNEENGLRGGIAYAATNRPGEKHLAAIESDEGGFAPRGFGVSDSAALTGLQRWRSAFSVLNVDRITFGGGGADISPLMRAGVPGFGLNVETHRYFDHHHSGTDVVGAVNERELALGAAAIATLAFIIAQEGL